MTGYAYLPSAHLLSIGILQKRLIPKNLRRSRIQWGKAVVHYVLTVLLAVFGWKKTTYIIIYIYNIIIIINNNDNNDNITYYNYTGTDFNYVQPA